MARVTIQFMCMHVLVADSDLERDELECPQCGDRRIRDVKVRAPRITAVDCKATGPLVVPFK